MHRELFTPLRRDPRNASPVSFCGAKLVALISAMVYSQVLGRKWC